MADNDTPKPPVPAAGAPHKRIAMPIAKPKPKEMTPEEQGKKVTFAHPDVLPKHNPAFATVPTGKLDTANPEHRTEIAARQLSLAAKQRGLKGAETRRENLAHPEKKTEAPKTEPPKTEAPKEAAEEGEPKKKLSPEEMLHARRKAVESTHKKTVSIHAALKASGQHDKAAEVEPHIKKHADELAGINKQLDELHAKKIAGPVHELEYNTNPATGNIHAHSKGDAGGKAGMYRILKNSDGKFEVHRRPSMYEKGKASRQTSKVKGADGKTRTVITPAAKLDKFVPTELGKFDKVDDAKRAAQSHHDHHMLKVTSRAAGETAHVVEDAAAHDEALREHNKGRQSAAGGRPDSGRSPKATAVAGAHFKPAPAGYKDPREVAARASTAALNTRAGGVSAAAANDPKFGKQAGNLRYVRPQPFGGVDGGKREVSPTPHGGGTVAQVRGVPETVANTQPHHQGQEDRFNSRWRAGLAEKLAVPTPPSDFRERSGEARRARMKKAICTCCHCDSLNKGEATMSKFEEIFKSDCTCPDCGGEIRKGGKAKKKGHGAKRLGNEMAPHRGKASGQVDHPRGGAKLGAVQRDAVTPKNKTVQPWKKGDEPTLNKAMFPCVERVALATYAGLDQDNALSKSVEANLKPGAGADPGLFVPPARNLAMEQEQASLNKAFPPKKDDEGSEDSESESEGSEGSDDSESGEESESESN